VDILMAQPKLRAMPVKAPPPSLKDFLKMALPSIPKVRAPLDVSAPDMKRDLMKIPDMKLEDKGRLKDPSKMAALDLSQRRLNLAKVAAPLEEARRQMAMDMPKLEEIGTRRAPPKILQMAALAEETRALAPAGLSVAAPELRSQHSVSAAPLLPAEASAGKPSVLSKMADMLTSDAQPLQMRPQYQPEPRVKSLSSEPAAPAPSKTAGLQQIKRKAVEIEGPLANRKVRSFSVPEFPQWAKEQGIMEADVSIRFSVDPLGNVLEDAAKVERSSGYGRLDRLALEHLKKWRFEALALGEGNQWGIITFRFILE
jgi:periplasmic protein TonB